LPAVPYLLILGSSEAPTYADKLNYVQITQDKFGISYDSKTSSRRSYMSWDYVPQVPNYQNFWIINSWLKGILRYSCTI